MGFYITDSARLIAPVFNVKGYGATGNGVTDDTGAAAAAIANASAAGGGIVYFPTGTYKTTAVLTIPSRVTLRGAGVGDSTIAGGSGFSIVKTASGGSADRVRIEDLTCDHTGDSTTAAILVQDATNVVCSNVRVIAGRWGIEYLNVTDGLVDSCEVTGQVGNAIPVAIYTAGTSARIYVHDCYVHDLVDANGGLGIFFDSTTSTQTYLGHKAIGNTVVNVSDNGIRFQTNPAQPLQGGYVCADNYVRDAKINAIRVNGFGASVTGNVVIASSQGEGGIRDTGSPSTDLTRSTITGNTCINLSGAFNSGGVDLHAGSSEVAIVGNYCEGWNNGIQLSGTDYTVSGNHCRGSGLAGIELQGVTNSTVSGNRCKNNGQSAAGHGGIELNSTCADVVIGDNRCYDDQGSPTQTYGIAVLTGADFCTVTGNDVRGNANATGILWQATTTNNRGLNNLGSDQNHGAPTVGVSPASLLNNNNVPAIYTVLGGTVSKIEYGHNVNGTTTFFDTGVTQGAFYVDVGDRLRITYTVAPTSERMPVK